MYFEQLKSSKSFCEEFLKCKGFVVKIYMKTSKIYINQIFFFLQSFNLNIKMLENSAQPTVASTPGFLTEDLKI